MAEPFRNLLVVDDEASMRHMLRLVLERNRYRVTEAQNGAAALQRLYQEKFDFILCDIRMPDMDGLTFLDQPEVKTLDHGTIIMMSAYGGIDVALECMKRGAYDYISKPFKPDEVVLTLRKAQERRQLRDENRQLKAALSEGKPFALADIVYRSAAMGQALERVKAAAGADSPVLISGETGTGKELIARALHSESRRKGPFLAVNCSAIAPGLLESELFGHKKGAFTGADREKQGLFSVAHGGTLFLDEIADLPLELQPKLLRVLQEGEVRKVGGTRAEKIDTRIVAATGTDLKEAVSRGRFRSDLYYRLAVVDIHVPPLHERLDDIPLLAAHFLTRLCRREGRPELQLDQAAEASLQSYHWPGNVRELENYLEKALIFSPGPVLELPPLSRQQTPLTHDAGVEEYSLKVAVRRLEEDYIRKALAETSGNRTRAAQLLEISLRSLMYKLKEYGIE